VIPVAAPLRPLLASLDTPTEPDLTFAAVEVPGLAGVRLGRSRTGPALLLELDVVDTHTSAIEIRNLAVRPNVTCRIRSAAGMSEGLFTVCMCTTPDPRLQDLFLDALQCLLSPTRSGGSALLRSAVEGLIELFSGLQRAPTTSVIGLWGEVFLMHAAERPDVLLDAWHQFPGDHYDFACRNERLEVKTTTGRRQHSFSLEQLTPPEGTRLLVASVVTESSAAGSTIQELITKTAARCTSVDAVNRLMSGAAKALGGTIGEWSGVRYDVARAEDSLLLIDGESVARPTVRDAEVWDVHFRVDLEGAAPQTLRLDGPLSSALGR